ncbi:unnamed protein product [Toxocara canis]|uniref:Ubiquitin carboxyl-terminal hydrolase n=1 Tax=Toxocara canis TaxID=6265 RepID=A0A183UDH3_TOXCA|nr:unnamed protein product [Toxocara canis]
MQLQIFELGMDGLHHPPLSISEANDILNLIERHPLILNEKWVFAQLINLARNITESTYVIGMDWWKTFISSIERGETTGVPPIDNASLCDRVSKQYVLKKNLIEKQDFILVPSAVFVVLRDMYGVVVEERDIIERNVSYSSSLLKSLRIEVYPATVRNKLFGRILAHVFHMQNTNARYHFAVFGKDLCEQRYRAVHRTLKDKRVGRAFARLGPQNKRQIDSVRKRALEVLDIDENSTVQCYLCEDGQYRRLNLTDLDTLLSQDDLVVVDVLGEDGVGLLGYLTNKSKTLFGKRDTEVDEKSVDERENDEHGHFCVRHTSVLHRRLFGQKKTDLRSDFITVMSLNGALISKVNKLVSATHPSMRYRSSTVLRNGLTTATNAHLVQKSYRPGVCGLENLGNTCFMNSALQCLSNVREITEYFRSGRYEQDINEENVLGMHGQLARAYADLIGQLWSGTSRSVAPRKLKAVIGQYVQQFSGYSQHDSQELLSFLLDGLHEDLNRVKKKAYVEAKDSDGRPDHVYKNFDERSDLVFEHDGIVLKVADEAWQMYKMGNDSIIVDYLHGQLKSTVVSVKFDPFCFLSVPLPPKEKLCKISVTLVPRSLNRKWVKILFGIISNKALVRVMDDDESLLDAHFPPMHQIFAYQVGVISITNEMATSQMNIVQVRNQLISTKDALTVPILMATSSTDSLNSDFIKESVLPRMKWNLQDKELVMRHSMRRAVAISECFDLFTRQELLSDDNLWYCPRCKEHQRATKKLDLWRLPPVLIVHLKRFHFTRWSREKIDLPVEFPLSGLDLTGRVVDTRCGKFVYDLIAVSNHAGGLGGGHYTAYARNGDDWYDFNDSTASAMGQPNDSIVSKEAYVLFYRRLTF